MYLARSHCHVSSPEAFDNRLYGINDLEAIHVDPQQRFVLDCVTMAMEDAGITRAMLKGSRTGVYMGMIFCLPKTYSVLNLICSITRLVISDAFVVVP